MATPYPTLADHPDLGLRYAPEPAPTAAAPSWTPELVAATVQTPEWQDTPAEERQSLLDEMLASAHDHESTQGDWTTDRQTQWRDFTQAMRATAQPSGWTTAGQWAAKPVTGSYHMTKGLLNQAATGVNVLLDAAGMPFGLTKGERVGEFASAVVANSQAWNAGAEELMGRALMGRSPVSSYLEDTKAQIDAGNVPADPEGRTRWLQQQDALLRGAQDQWYQAANPWDLTPGEDAAKTREAYIARHNLSSPQHQALMAAYVKTGNPALWDQLQQSLEMTPDREEAQRSAQAVRSMPMANAANAMGLDRNGAMQLGDPVNWLLMSRLGLAGREAAAANTWANLGVRALKTTPEMAAVGGAYALREDPLADAGTVGTGAADMALTGAGFTALTGTGGKLLRGQPRAPGEPVPVKPTPAGENPFKGPIEAPPQPVEGGGVVVPEKPLPPVPVVDAPVMDAPVVEGPVVEAPAASARPAPAEPPAAPGPSLSTAADGVEAGASSRTLPQPAALSSAQRRMVERTLTSQGVESDVAAGMVDRLGLPADLAPEALRDAALQAFTERGGVLPEALPKQFLDQPAAYEAQGFSREESQVHAANSRAMHEQAVAEAHATNRRVLTGAPETFDPVTNPGPEHLPADQAGVFTLEKAIPTEPPAPARPAAEPRAVESPATATDAARPPARELPVSEEEALPFTGGPPATPGPLPSKAGGVAPSSPAGTWSGEVQTLHGIRQYLLKLVGIPRVGVGRFRKALGIYKVRAEAIRLQAINDIPVLAHEIGHDIHYTVLGDATHRMAPDWGGAHDAELMPLGRTTSAPSYTAAQVRKEGVAEFTRLWLTDPAQARAAAPGFSAFWEAELEARNPQLAAGLREGQRRIADYVAMPGFEKAKAQIVFDPAAEAPRRTVGEWLRGQYTHCIDTLQPAKRALQRAAQMDPTLATEAQRVEAWMENHRGGWQSKAHADVFGRQTDLNGRVIGDGMQTILKDLQPGDAEAFSTYLALKRAQEIEAQGKQSGFEQAHLPAAEMTALEARFEPTRQKLLKWTDNSLQLLVDAGLLDKDAAARMRAANRDYVPFYRLYEKLNGVSLGPEQSANSGGYVDLSSGIRRLKGSDRAIMDPLQSLMKNAFMFRKLAEQNHIGVQFFDVMKKLQGHGQFADSIAPKMVGKKISHEAIVQELIDEGVIQSAADLPAGADLTLTLWEAMKRPDTKTGEVIIFREGKREHWEVKDPLLMKALKTADADAVRLASFLGPVVTKFLTLPARVQRFGATGGPWFAIPNFVRDQFTAAVQSRTGYVPFLDGLRGAREVWRDSPIYKRWKETGGEFSGITTHTQAFRSMLDDVLPKDRGARAMAAALASPRHWRGALGAAGKLLEEATRVGEFARGVRQGMTEMEAANASKAVSLNFARSGEHARTINMLSAFFNAKLQEMDMIVQNHRTRPVNTIMKGLMYITVPSVACWLLGKDDKKIQALPEWRKNLFWNINLDGVAQALGYQEGFILSVPKPFLMGQVYGTTIERALDHATGRDPNGWRKAMAGLLQAPSEIAKTPLNIAGIKPLIEAVTNYDFYRGRAVVPDRMRNLPPEQQYDTMTSETAKLVGQALGLSPMMIDHQVRAYFATAGTYGTSAIDWGMTKLGIANSPPAPEKGWMELPVLNRFSGSPYAANAYVERFYKAAADMEGMLSTFNKQSDQMTTADQQRWWQKHGADVMFFQRTTNAVTRGTAAGDVRKAQRTLSEIGKAMKDVQADRQMTPSVKRQRLTELAKQRNTTAEQAFKDLFPESVRLRHY